MTALHPADSAVETTLIVQPPDSNFHGTLFGGRIMAWMDMAAAISASRHCRESCVTVAVDDLVFERAIRVGDVVIIRAQVNHTGRTSMEVGVKVFREHPKTREREHCLTGYFTFVSVDREGRPIPVPEVVPTSEDEHRRFQNAEERRQQRLERLSLRREAPEY